MYNTRRKRESRMIVWPLIRNGKDEVATYCNQKDCKRSRHWGKTKNVHFKISLHIQPKIESKQLIKRAWNSRETSKLDVQICKSLTLKSYELQEPSKGVNVEREKPSNDWAWALSLSESHEDTSKKMEKKLLVRQEENQKNFLSWKPRKENISKTKGTLTWLDDAENQLR